MKKVFEARYNEHEIIVENRWFTGERLYVDGNLQDENLGLGFRATLYGQIRTEDRPKIIKVTVGGNFQINCKIFVDNEVIDTYLVK